MTLPPDAEPLLAAVRARPGDDLPRLVLADWLDEHGLEPAWAAYVRLACLVAGPDHARCRRTGSLLPSATEYRMRCRCGVRTARRRLYDLWRRVGTAWAAGFRRTEDGDGAYAYGIINPWVAVSVRPARGFFETARTLTTIWLTRGPAWVRHPLACLTPHPGNPRPVELADVLGAEMTTERVGGELASVWHWRRGTPGPQPPGTPGWVLPAELYDALPGPGDGSYPTVDAAMDGLAAGCVRWAEGA